MPVSRAPIPTWYFVVVVVRRGSQFLLVHERKFGRGWYLPAGRVEPGELLADGAIRETKEEAGCEVRLTGIYRVEHTPRLDGARMRVIFGAEAVADSPLKSAEDEHSLGAGWFTLAEIASLPLRAAEVLTLLRDVAAGAPLHSLSLLTCEEG